MIGNKTEKGSVLIVDDEEGIRVALGNLFRHEGYLVQVAENRNHAIQKVRKEPPDAVLLDISLGDEDGVEVLKVLKEKLPDTAFIMITGHGSIDSSVQAMKNGAADYILKPIDNVTILEAVRKNLEIKALRTENSYLKAEIRQVQDIRNIHTRSPRMLEILSVADRIKDTLASILITGESGSGKELLARYIHFSGNRRNGNFVGVNSAALSESLLLSELFGHEKGAFTGAIEQRPGKFEMADGGTLFLDEIGDMSLEIQAKILRVLEEKSFERVGGIRPISVDVRIIAATNRNLQTLIENKLFRNDLYYRLKVISCTLPPLRDRPEDIPILIDEFISFYNERYGKKIQGMSPVVMEKMQNHSWPGNIRELRNLINQAVLLCDGLQIDETSGSSFTFESFDQHAPTVLSYEDSGEKNSGTMSRLKDTVGRYAGDFESRTIVKALDRNQGNKTRTAEELGISRKTLTRKIQRYGL